MSLKAIQSRVDAWIHEYGVRYFDPLTNMALLAEETGEVARLLARIHGEQSFKKEISVEDANAQLADELADLLFVAVCIANQSSIDLDKAMDNSFKKKTKRDSKRHRENKKLS